MYYKVIAELKAPRADLQMEHKRQLKVEFNSSNATQTAPFKSLSRILTRILKLFLPMWRSRDVRDVYCRASKHSRVKTAAGLSNVLLRTGKGGGTQ
jgi:hypothetical protein